MNRQFNRTGFAGLAILTAIAVQTTALSAEETSTFDASKQKCDVTLSVDDLGNIHPPKAKRRFKIALVQVTLSGYFYQSWIYGAQKAAEEAGVDFTVAAGQGFSTSAQQVTRVENAIARGVDAVVLDPADVNGTIRAVDLAAEKGIPIISAGTLVNSPESDPSRSGRLRRRRERRRSPYQRPAQRRRRYCDGRTCKQILGVTTRAGPSERIEEGSEVCRRRDDQRI